MTKIYSIRDLSEEFDVTPRAIRFYEAKGMLSPERDGQTRIFLTRDHTRLRLIVRSKRLGFSLDEIKEMLDFYDSSNDQAEQLKVTLQKCRERVDMLERQKHDIDDTISELTAYCSNLETLLRPDGLAA